jgi:hypothetical protein
MHMRTAASFIALLFIALSTNAQDLTLIDVLEPVFPDSNAVQRYGTNYEAHFPSGTVADVHLLLSTRGGESVTVSADLNGRRLPVTCWSRLIDVPVEQNTGLDSRTEKFTGQHNPYVIRRAPFRIYEVVQPMQTASVTAKDAYTALRLGVPPRFFPAPGSYSITITAKGTNWKRTGIFTATVHASRLPPLKESSFLYTNWFNLVQMEQKHNVTRWSNEWYAMLDNYAALMASGRQNTINIPGELISVTASGITLDDSRLSAFVDVFRRYGFRYFESPHLMYRGDSDDWADPELKVSATGRRYHTPEGRRDVATVVRLIKDFTTRHGLTRNWLQHISDEPGAVQAQCYKEVVQQVRAIYPSIQIMDATSDRDTLAGAVDVWCPTIDDFQKNESFFRGRERHNEKVLVYTCLIPGGQWLNRLLDQERLRQVYFGWGAAAYNTAGYLHWGLNQYQVADPYRQSVVHHPSPQATPENFLPAGDTHIVYPGPAGPLSSTRFEAMRIGVEDYELLQKMKVKDSSKAAEIIRKIFRNYTEYSTDVVTYRTVRKELLDALQRR